MTTPEEHRPDQPGATPAPFPPPPDREPDILSTVRASDADRNAVTEHLRDAFADGRLDEEEFDVRMQRALSATSRQDLDRLVVDLGLPQPQAGVPIQAGPSAPATSSPRHGTNIAWFDDVKRRGRWTVPEELSAVAVLGDVKLDLRAATLTSAETILKAQAVLGDVHLIVPPGVRVEVDGSEVLGKIKDQVEDAQLPPTAPVVRVEATAVLGDVKTRTRAPGESDKPRWWRKLTGS